MASQGPPTSSRCRLALLEFELLYLYHLLAVLLGDGPHHGPIFAFRADRFVVFLAADVIEVIDNVLAVFLHLDNGVALFRFLEITLRAGDLALQSRVLALLV